MTVTAANLTASRTGTDANSFSTAAVTPSSANNLVLVTVYNSLVGGSATLPSISGGGVTTWVQVATALSTGTNTERITVFRGMTASPGAAAAITITFGGTTQSACGWSVDEFANVDTSGTNGSGAVVQALTATDNGSVTSGLVTLAAFSSVNNATFGAFGHNNNESTTAGTGFTRLCDQFGTGPTTGLATEFRNDNDTTVDASWSTGSKYQAVGIEIAAGSVVTPTAFTGWGQPV